MTAGDPLLAVHGGAGRLPRRALSRKNRAAYEEGLASALKAGWRTLRRGGSALKAVTEAVAVLEDHQLFNAGRGAALCADGTAELSASLMNGKSREVGAMVGLRRARNPIRAAGTLIGHAHGLLFGEEADRYAAQHGIEQVPQDYFRTEHRWAQWQKRRGTGKITLDHDEENAHGTVGAVARDRRGNLAAATSTGGLVNQLPGRVGDTPVVGAGTWADNGVCAVSATGKGDAFARVAFARRVADLIELGGLSAQEAAESALEEVKNVGGEGGCILIDRNGMCVLPFNSAHMLRGWIGRDGRPHVAIGPDQDVELPAS